MLHVLLTLPAAGSGASDGLWSAWGAPGARRPRRRPREAEHLMARRLPQQSDVKKVGKQHSIDPEATANWPWTPGPTTRAQRIKRALIG